jgi:hypothetical protein
LNSKEEKSIETGDLSYSELFDQMTIEGIRDVMSVLHTIMENSSNETET